MESNRNYQNPPVALTRSDPLYQRELNRMHAKIYSINKSRRKNNTFITKDQPCPALQQPRGFTLLEILLALFIFAILATLVTGALRTVIQAHNRNEQAAAQLQQLQFAMTLMQNDLQQMIDRPVLDVSGNPMPAFSANTASNNDALEFTRAGLINPYALAQRSTLQRVAYHLQGNTLVRETWDVLDRVNTTQPVQRPLLTGVTSLKFRFMGLQNQFYDNWPPPAPPNTKTPPLVFPRGIEVTLTLPSWGTLTRIFAVPGVGFGAQQPYNPPL